jgi:DNA-binding NarL/FixJ family response regulator
VGEATNGAEALRACEQLAPNLVLMDVRMPDMDGLTATAQIKAAYPNVSVIIVTMHENADYLAQALRAGASAYLLKDVGRAQLLDTIQQVFEGGAFLNSKVMTQLLTKMFRPQGQDAGMPLETLTARERDVLQLIVQGKTNREIAAALVVSPGTVKQHVEHILSKMGVSDRTQAAVRALQLGLVVES